MHPQTEVFQAEFAKILPGDREWIEVVLFKIPPKSAAAFLVFSPEKPRGQKHERYDDRGDDIDAELALQNFNHALGFNSVTQFSKIRSFANRKLRPQITGFQLG